MERLGREDAAELTMLADHLTAHGLVLETPAGPLPGPHDPTGPGKLLSAFFAAPAQTERENIRKSTLEERGEPSARASTAADRRPSPTTCSTPVVRRRANGDSVEQSRPGPTVPTGRRKGQDPSVVGTCRALAEHAEREAYPEAVEAAHADFAALGRRTSQPAHGDDETRSVTRHRVGRHR